MRTSIVQVATLLCFSGAVFGADLSSYEATCVELGFKKRTPAYGDCVLELDRRSTDQQKQADLLRIDQQRQAEQQRQADQQRQEQQRQEQQRQAQQRQEQQRASELAARGDGTPDHKTCNGYGFQAGTNPYAECRMKLDMARRDIERKQVAYEEDSRRYQEQVAAYEKEQERKKNMRLLEFSARLMGTTSPSFSQSVGNAAAATLGIAPIAPQRPAIENYTITMPGGRMTSCTYIPSTRNMNCF